MFNMSLILNITDALPWTSNSFTKIPLTDESAFVYAYKSKLGGMVITDYIKQSPKVNIPENLEGEPVVCVDLSKCEKEILVLILPDSAKNVALSKTIRETLEYIKVPKGNVIKASRFKGYLSLRTIACGDKLYDCEYKDSDIFEPDLDIPALDYELKIENGVVTGVKGKPTDIVIPFGVTEIGNSTLEGVFEGHGNLKSVVIPDSVRIIGPKAFRDTGLTEVIIPNSVTKICWEAFCGCGSLSSVHIGDGVTEIGQYAFVRCYELTSMNFPDSVKKIGSEVFTSCGKLTVTLGSGITRLEPRAFASVDVIKVIYNGKTYTNEDLGELERAINYDENGLEIVDGVLKRALSGVTDVVIPDGVIEITDYAFGFAFRNESLSCVTIPNSVTKIGKHTFNKCDNARVIYKGKIYTQANMDDLYKAINGN